MSNNVWGVSDAEYDEKVPVLDTLLEQFVMDVEAVTGKAGLAEALAYAGSTLSGRGDSLLAHTLWKATEGLPPAMTLTGPRGSGMTAASPHLIAAALKGGGR